MNKLLLLLFLIPNLVIGDDSINPNPEIIFSSPINEYRSCKIADVSQVCKLLGECESWNFPLKGYSYDDFEIFLEKNPKLNIQPKALTLADVESKFFFGYSHIDFLHSDIRVNVRRF